MSRTDVETVALLFERFSAGDLEGALELISEDAVLEVPASVSAEPDVYLGHDGTRRYLRGFEGTMEDVRFTPHDFLEENGLVVVPMVLSGRGVTSGIEVGVKTAVVAWVEDGRVTRLEPHPDLEEALERARTAR